MNRKILIIGLLLLAATFGFTQTPPASEPTPAPGPTNEVNLIQRPNRPRPNVLMPQRVSGTLVKLDGNNLVIRPNQRAGDSTNNVTLTTGTFTTFQVNGPHGKLDDLKPGMLVTVLTLSVTNRPARQIVRARSTELMGALLKSDGTNLTLSVRQPGGEPKQLTVATDEKTQVRFLGQVADGKPAPPRDGKVADLKPGMRLRVVPAAGKAEKITASPESPGAGAAAKENP